MAIQSSTDIANMALNAIGGGSIANIIDSSKQAKLCNLFFDTAVDQALTRVESSRHTKRRELTLLSQWDRQDYQYKYELPANYIKALELDTGDDFEVEGGCLFTNAYLHNINRIVDGVTASVSSKPILTYIARPDNYSTIQPFMANFIAANLAQMIVSELFTEQWKVAKADAFYSKSYVFAKSHNLSERKGRVAPPSKWSDVFDAAAT